MSGFQNLSHDHPLKNHTCFQLPDAKIEHQPKSQTSQPKPQSTQQNGSGPHQETGIREYAVDGEGGDDIEEDCLNATPKALPRQWLSTFESIDGGMDLESSWIDGSEQQRGIPPVTTDYLFK